MPVRRPTRQSAARFMRAAVLLGAGFSLVACSGTRNWAWDETQIEEGDAWPPYWTVADCGEVAQRSERDDCIRSISRGSPIQNRPGS